MTTPASPFICDLAALDAHEQTQRVVLGAQVMQVARERHELPNGFAFILQPTEATRAAATQWITLEQRCCPFLTLALDEDSSGTLWLKMTGEEGIKEFLIGELGAAGEL